MPSGITNLFPSICNPQIFDRENPFLGQKGLVHERMPNLELVQRPSAHVTVSFIIARLVNPLDLQLAVEEWIIDIDGRLRPALSEKARR